MQLENPHSQSDAKAEAANHPVVAKLEAAAQDLLFVSETDAPLTPFFWPSDAKEFTPELLAQFAKLSDEIEIGTQTLTEFFEPAMTEAARIG